MILQQLHIDGFGKLSNLDLTFSDNLNLIYGNNETGKSTICSFIFHMLYGLERGRGRASRYDTYIHYLPWNATTYGGSLTFSADGFTWFLERNFLTDSRIVRLTRLDDGKNIPDPEATLSHLLSPISESVFRTLFFLSGQSLSNNSVFSELLRSYTQNPTENSSVHYSSTDAIQALKRQKKSTALKLSGSSSGDLLRTDEELEALELRIASLEASSVTSSASHSEMGSSMQTKPGEFLLIAGILFSLIGILLLAFPSLWIMLKLPILPTLPAVFSLVTGFILMLSFLHRSVIATRINKCTPSEHSLSELSPDVPVADDAAFRFFSELNSLLSQRETLLEKKELLTAQLSADFELKQQIRSIDLAIETISALSSDIHHLKTPDLQRSFLRHARILTGRQFTQLFMDEAFRFSLLEEGHHIPLEGLSQGTIAQLQFSCRLAAMELLYPDTSIPLLLDDIFSTTDDARLTVLLSHLNADYPGQKILFSCQKREAAILSQHSLSYHLIELS